MTNAPVTQSSAAPLRLLAMLATLGAPLVGCIDAHDDEEVELEETVDELAQTFTVGGTLSGLPTGASATLRNNKENLAVRANGTFVFKTTLKNNASYSVTVPSSTVPCTVTRGQGVIKGANVIDVDVRCGTTTTTTTTTTPPPAPATYSVGGWVTGLNGTVVLRNNAGDDLAVSANGSFAFATKLLDKASYNVTIHAQPATQVCSLRNASGAIAGANVSTVAVDCVATTRDFYVDATDGNDANDGTAAAPWRTITKAIQTAPTTGANIRVAPGTYSAGETFPISPRANQRLIGDVANRGEGPVPTRISGSGAFNCSGGDLANSNIPVAVGLERGAEGSSIEGFSITGGNENVWVCNVDATLASNTMFGSTDIAVVIGYRANVTLSGNTIKDGAYGLLAHDADTRVVARGNTFGAPGKHSVVLGFASPFMGSNMDFGTTANPGNNVFTGSVTGVGLSFQYSTSSVVSAVGNTWRANVQSADVEGRYSSQLVTTNIGAMAGSNFATRFTTGGGLQF